MNPRLWPGKAGAKHLPDPTTEIPELKRMGTDFVFVDLPPENFDIIRPGIAACDFVVIPCKASPIDLEALGPILQVCEEERVDCRVPFTMYEPNWTVSGSAFKYIERLRPGKTLPETMNQLQAYVGSAISSHANSEYNRDSRQAAAELNAIWTLVRKLALAAARANV
jgi:chromosome partitioning protein